MKKVRIFPILIFFLMGAFFNLGGVVILNMADKFRVDSSVIAYTFTFYTVFHTLALMVNGYFLKKIPVKTEILASLAICLLAIVQMTFSMSILGLTVANIMFGFGSGILVSVSNYMMIALYNDEERSSKLTFLNFFYSFGAIIAPMLAGYLLKIGVKWESIYNANFVYIFIIIIIAINSDFNSYVKKDEDSKGDSLKERWSIAVYLIGVALMAYVASEISFAYWIVTYMKDINSVDIAMAGLFLSVFWIFMAIGRISAGRLIARLKTHRYLMIFSTIAVVSYLFIFNINSVLFLYVAVAFMGIGFSGLYPAMLSFGTLQLKKKSAKVMTYLITMGGIGGMIAVPISSTAKRLFGLRASIIVSILFIIAVAVIINISIVLIRKKERVEVN